METKMGEELEEEEIFTFHPATEKLIYIRLYLPTKINWDEPAKVKLPEFEAWQSFLEE